MALARVCVCVVGGCVWWGCGGAGVLGDSPQQVSSCPHPRRQAIGGVESYFVCVPSTPTALLLDPTGATLPVAHPWAQHSRLVQPGWKPWDDGRSHHRLAPSSTASLGPVPSRCLWNPSLGYLPTPPSPS